MDSTISATSNVFNSTQLENFKRQISLLEHKLEMTENDYSTKVNSLQEQISILNNNEIKLRNQLTTKDKALYELNSIIKEYQTEVINLKKSLCISEEKLSSMSNHFNSIRSNCNNISLALNSREESHIKLESAYNELLKEHERSKNKMNELIEVMKNYSNEMNILTDKCTKLEQENFDFKNTNIALSNNLKRELYQNETNETNLDNMRKDIEEYQNINTILTEENKKLKNHINDLNNELYTQNENYSHIVIENEQLHGIISNLKIEKNILENDVASNVKMNQKNIEKIAQNESDNNTIITDANDNIKIIINWIENYIGICFAQNVTIPDLPLHTTKTPKLLFEQLKLKLQEKREKINNQMLQQEILNRKISNDIIELEEKLSFIIKKVKDIYNAMKFEIQKNKYFDIDFSNYNSNVDDIMLLEDIINQFMQFAYRDKILKNSNANKSEEAIKENDVLKRKIDMIINENDQMRNEYQMYNKYKEDSDNLMQEMRILDKRNKNLQTEIDLKTMQIKSLEEMLNRRNGNFANSSDRENIEKIKRLEIDKNNLIKDNMILIQENNTLKQKTNSLY